ncbi:response regulator [Georgenia sp. EYE_87]|uniref:response regulator n=1 Tax=Georgenia sp. EYE_87 TaxID=2853448 RepID=UPI002005BFA3|nr:response regulator [Georgenia sp. EYE_87]MCK6210263.1 response regulator [Georgenia sp. EYE_87]
MTRLLLVEDDAALVRTLSISLEARGFEVEATGQGNRATALARAHPPEVAIIDLGLPDTDGINVVRALRTWSDLPILILSAREAQEEKVAALDAGADDYVTKPFGMDELLARLRAALRRTTPEPAPAVVRAGQLTIDVATRRVERAGGTVHLTPTEWNLLEVLVRATGALVTHRDLLQAVWGPQYADETNYLRVYMAQLRRKLEEHPSAPRHLITEPGVGYRFEP